MMRGISYDDNYISRKMNTFDPTPSYGSHVSPYGPYGQESNLYGPADDIRIGRDEPLDLTSENIASPVGRPGFTPSARTQLILNRVALSQPRGYSPAPRGYLPRVGPPPATYYDYDYGYGPGGYGGYGGYGYRPQNCGYGYGYPPPPPLQRYRNMDAYLDDDYDMNYVPRYRPSRLSDALVELEKEKHGRSVSPVITRTVSTALPSTDYLAKHFSPGMLHDQVDKMRTRLQAMSYSLDPTVPGAELAYPEKSRFESGKKYSSGPKHLACVDFAGGAPQWKRKAMTRYPKEDPNHLSELSRNEIQDAEVTAEKEPERLILKDRLSMRIHNYLSDTLSPQKFERYLKSYRNPGSQYDQLQVRRALPTYTSKLSSGRAGDDSSKWEEPGTVYSRPSDTKNYSKTNEVEEDDQKKERRRKKKSKEREEAPVLPIESSETAGVSQIDSSAPVENGAVPTAEADVELDEKEKKRLEKKKKKAEREAAAKAAMEAELAALAEAEAELARLEAESAGVKAPQELKTESSVLSPAAELTEPKTEPQPQPEPEPEVVASEEVIEKCESQTDNSVALSSECVPPATETECQPSILSSSEPIVSEESLQDHVEIPSEAVEQTQPQSEPEEQVTESVQKSSADEESMAAQPDTAPEESQLQAPQMTDGEPTFRSEAVIWDDSNDAVDNAGDDSLVSAGAGDATQTGFSDESEVQPQETKVSEEDEIIKVDDSGDENRGPALSESVEEEKQQEEPLEEESVHELVPVEDFWTNQDQADGAENTDVVVKTNQEAADKLEDLEIQKEDHLENAQNEPETIQPVETEEVIEERQVVDQEVPADDQQEEQGIEEEPNLDDVPLNTDVDIFADRGDD